MTLPPETAGPLRVFIADDELESLRAAKIAREFERDAIVIGSGTEFRRLDAIRGDGLAQDPVLDNLNTRP